jgi:hypothetical protein
MTARAIACWLNTSEATMHAERATTLQGAMPFERVHTVRDPPHGASRPAVANTRAGPGGETPRRFGTVRPHTPSASHHQR